MGKSIRPQEFDGLPAFLLADVEERCRGDWRRVTLSPDGSLIVHNKPVSQAKAAKKASTGPKPKPRSAPVEKGGQADPDNAPVPPSPAVEWKHTVLPPALPPQRRAGRKAAPEGLKPLQAPPVPVRERTAWDELPSHETLEDWKAAGDRAPGWYALRMKDLAANGLPRHIRPKIAPDVLITAGVTEDAVYGTLYAPQRVEVAEETTTHGYPILRFYRGDVCTVLGLRVPQNPKVIASYPNTWALQNRSNHSQHGGTGGGGARKEEGLPKNGPALLRRLRSLGAECVPVEKDSLKCLHKVTYHGQDLGQVPGDTITPRKEIETHYQRTQRRIAAINLKRESQTA